MWASLRVEGTSCRAPLHPCHDTASTPALCPAQARSATPTAPGCSPACTPRLLKGSTSLSISLKSSGFLKLREPILIFPTHFISISAV